MLTRPTPASPQPYCVFDTALGPVGVAWSDGGLTRLQLPEADWKATEQRLRMKAALCAPAAPPASVKAAIEEIERYFAGSRVDFASVALDLAGIAPFYREVYAAARRVGWGETLTYGELARRAGAPGAARAVGQALSRNPIAVIIPCHRILASGNRIGGFSAFGGTVSKERLLGLEGMRVGRGRAAGQLLLSEQW